MSKLLRKKTRQFSAATLIASAVILLLFLFVDHSRSANPTNGTITPSGPDVVWNGTAAGGTSQLSEDSCVEGISCDTFLLTISGTPADWVGKKVHLDFTWIDPANDYDVYIHKGADNTGPIAGSSTNTHLSTNYERIDLDPNQPSIGTGVFSVHVIYFIVAPQTGIGPAPANDQYHAVASAVAAAVATPTPTPGGSATPTPPPLVGTPRFHHHYTAPGVADDAGEPTMGVNWKSEQSFSNNNIVTGAPNPPIPNGGTSNYYGGFLSYMLRVRFNDCSSPAMAPFEQMPVTLPAAPRGFGDPILFTDHLTGRTFVAQLEGLTPAGSTMEYTDDDGDTFSPSQGAGPSCVDHQTIGGGPFRPPIPGGVTSYPNAVYYASQCVGDATSELSVDGGITFPIQTTMYTAAQCEGLHGHIKIAEDGTAYVPNKACGVLPRAIGGEASILVSEDNGATWALRPIPGAHADVSVDDPSVGVSWCPPGPLPCDKVARSNTIYLGFLYDDDPATTNVDERGRPGIAVSHDRGVTWSTPVDIGALSGVAHAAFPAVSVGDPDRAAFAFFGTTTAASNYDAPEFAGVWYLYIASTFDGGATWTVQNVTPGDPIQRGGICGDGTCRNLLDFFDSAIDKEGRLLIAGEDGCIGSCVNGGPNSFTAKAFISRQSGGKRMFAAFDPVEPALPGAPLVGGSLNPTTGKATLSWPLPDNGASPITAYKIYRAPAASGPFTLLATVPVNNYTDSALLADNWYRVTAVNAIGEGPYCKEFHPAIFIPPDPCKLPGVLVTNDFNSDGSDKDSGVNTPIDPSVNARQLYVAEPFFGSGVNKLVFTLQVAPSPGATSAPPNSQWFIIWNRISGPAADGSDRIYVAMRSDSSGAVTFEYGNFGPPLDPTAPVPNANTPTKVGDADSGTFDPVTGVITITVSNSKLENIAVGNDLAGLNIRTYFNRPDPGQRSQNNASDITDDTSYALRGNAFCAIAETGKLFNISTREQVGTGDNVLIGGFIITGGVPKKVILRGIGPSLQNNGAPYPGRMADPTLELHDSNTVIATNNDWQDTQPTEVQNSGIPPTDPKESAIVRTLDPGAYTVILRGNNNSTGTAVVEVYDLDTTGASELANISSRGLVGTGDNILIGGFFTGPTTAAHTKVVVRAMGPSIKNQVPNALNDPTLELRDSFGVVVRSNDDWMETQKAEIEAAGLAPTNNAESALLETLTPGNYTVLVRGKNETGVGLVEIYHIP
jgi:hypothetical protein